MRPLHSLLVLILLAAVGIGGWLLVSSDETPEGIAPALPATELANETSKAPTELDTSLTRVDEPEAARTELETEPEVEVAAETDGPRREIIGRIVDARGNAVAGAKIFAAPKTGLGGMLADLAGEESLPWIQREETTSGDDGRFAVSAPDGVRARLAIRQPGFAPYDGEHAVSAKDSFDVGDIALEDSVVLSGRVVDSRGRGVARAELFALPTESDNSMIFFSSSGQMGRLVAKTDPQGNFRIDQMESGPYRVMVKAEAHPDLVQEGMGERPGFQQHGITWTLDDGFSIEGKLVGLPVGKASQVWVRAQRTGDSSDETQIVSHTSGPDSDSARRADVREDGTFAVTGLRRDKKYRLSAREGDGRFWAPSRSASVTARSGDRGVELSWRVESAIVFQVVDSRTGDPLEDFEVKAGTDWNQPLQDEQGRKVEHHPEGRVRFGGLQAKKNGSTVSLEIDAKGYEHFDKDDIELKAGEELELGTLRLIRVPLVHVRVVDDETGEPVRRARVTMSEDKKNGMGMGGEMSFSFEMEDDMVVDSPFGGSSSTERTDDEGMASFSSMPGKRVKFSVKHKSYSSQRAGGVDLPVGSDHELEIRLEVGGTVVVTVVDVNGEPVSGVKVDHRSPGQSNSPMMAIMGGSGRDVTDADGKKTFEHLEEGTHSFRIGKGGGPQIMMAGGGGGEMEVSAVMVGSRIGGPGGGAVEEPGWEDVLVAARETAELTLVAPTKSSLIGKVTEAGKPLAGAQVRLKERRSGSGGGPDMDLDMEMFGGSSKSDKADGSGRFEIKDVDSGDYSLVITHSTRMMPYDFEVSLAEGENDVGTLDLPVCIVEGRITNQQGDPISGIRVTVERAQEDGPGSQVRFGRTIMAVDGDSDSSFEVHAGPHGTDVVMTDADGRYELRGVEPERELQVNASGNGLRPERSETFVLDPGEVRDDVDFSMKQGGSIDITALKPDGTPVSFCLVTATYSAGDEENVDPETGFIEQNGKTSLTGLAPGTWTINLRPMGFGQGEDPSPPPTQDAEVVAGETVTLTFDMP